MYFLFFGTKYYPAPAFGDYRGTFPSVLKAKQAFEASDIIKEFAWAQVLTVHNEKLTLVSELESGGCEEWMDYDPDYGSE